VQAEGRDRSSGIRRGAGDRVEVIPFRSRNGAVEIVLRVREKTKDET